MKRIVIALVGLTLFACADDACGGDGQVVIEIKGKAQTQIYYDIKGIRSVRKWIIFELKKFPPKSFIFIISENDKVVLKGEFSLVKESVSCKRNGEDFLLGPEFNIRIVSNLETGEKMVCFSIKSGVISDKAVRNRFKRFLTAF